MIKRLYNYLVTIGILKPLEQVRKEQAAIEERDMLEAKKGWEKNRRDMRKLTIANEQADKLYTKEIEEFLK